MSDTVVSPRASAMAERRERVREDLQRRTHSYTELAKRVRELGLNARTPWFYLTFFVVLVALTGAVFTGMVLLDNSWWQLAIAAVLGVILTQFAFLTHEASHRQILASGKANDWIGRILATLFVGVSYAWWMNKHTRHHGNPNKVGKDPDLAPDPPIVMLEEDAASTRGLHAWFVRRQGWLFFPLLPLFGISLHAASFRGLARPNVAKRWVEIAFIAVRLAAYLFVLFWLMPVGLAFAFLGVQLAVFGVYLGTAFAPNHIGMRIVPKDLKLDFLDKQVSTARNVSGGWWCTLLMGGLNYQIEHHLFPAMSRLHLRRARTLVKEQCLQSGIEYVEEPLPVALGHVVRHLNKVGLSAPLEFSCPTASRMGR